MGAISGTTSSFFGFYCEVWREALQTAAKWSIVESGQAARPNNPAMKRAWPTASPLASHLTLPFRIMCTVSIPCIVRHARQPWKARGSHLHPAQHRIQAALAGVLHISCVRERRMCCIPGKELAAAPRKQRYKSGYWFCELAQTEARRGPEGAPANGRERSLAAA